MNILVTGANGQLGNEMQICSKSNNGTYFFTDVCEGYEHLDITDLQAVKEYVRRNNIHAIVNCAAWTNVDGAEDPAKYELVEKLNATAPENLAVAMKEVGGFLVHISTDYVFGKEPYNTPCREDQTGTPHRSLWADQTPRRKEDNRHRLQLCDNPHRLALLRIRQELL